MKKTNYIIACFLGFTSVAFGQTPLKVSEQAIADVTVLNDELILYSQKNSDGQFIYSEKKQEGANPKKEPQLNKGIINAVAGTNLDASQVYVYQKYSRKKEAIVFFEWKDNAFRQVGERILPKLKNNSSNLGYFLTEDQQHLIISAELGGSQGQDDIYVSHWDGKAWSNPKNLGSAVNSRQAEFAPFVNGDKLYFSRQEEGAAYVYSVSLKNGMEPVGEPVKLDGRINQDNAFNAYYKKRGEEEVWISADEVKGYTAYFNGAVATKPVANEAETIVEEATVATAPEAKYDLEYRMHYSLNQVRLNEEAARALELYLAQLPSGTEIQIKGYSDGVGSVKAKAEVSRQRASFLQEHITKNFAAKKFILSTSSEVLQEKGDEFRIAELKVQK